MDKQHDSLGYSIGLESRGFIAEAALLRTQHALLQGALQALNAEAEWCISGGDTPSGITLSAIAALNQHLDQK